MERTEARRSIEKAVTDAIRSHTIDGDEAVVIAKAAAIMAVYQMTQETAREIYGSCEEAK